ncbi:MAG TPA: Uma2 family endonuclease [Planctomycetaceae bacterium]|nr:Uma2 family endonuclease [Planctomycetaceae bacterium]
MSAVSLPFVSQAEYLERERSAPTKSEYFRGEIFLMAGGSEAHNLISLNIGTALNNALADRPCRVYPSDQRYACPTGLITYPDVSVVCGEREYLDDRHDTLLNPLVLVEVLSASTEGYDRGKKFEHYRTISSLREYILVAPDSATVERFVRESTTGKWTLSEYHGFDAVLMIDALECSLGLREIYRKVELPPASPTANV